MNPIRAALASVFVALVATACSAGVLGPVGSDGGTGDPPGDGGGGCVDPTEGAACTSSQRACSSGGNLCCIGYAFICSNGAWRKESVGCACVQPPTDGGTDATPRDAGPVTCGSKTCTPNEVCTKKNGGAAPPDGGSNTSYSCDALPAACVANPTCACLQANGGTGGCSCADVNGRPAVTCNYP